MNRKPQRLVNCNHTHFTTLRKETLYQHEMGKHVRTRTNRRCGAEKFWMSCWEQNPGHLIYNQPFYFITALMAIIPLKSLRRKPNKY